MFDPSRPPRRVGGALLADVLVVGEEHPQRRKELLVYYRKLYAIVWGLTREFTDRIVFIAIAPNILPGCPYYSFLTLITFLSPFSFPISNT